MAQHRTCHDQGKAQLLSTQVSRSQMDRQKAFQKITDEDQSPPEGACMKKNIGRSRISVAAYLPDVQAAEDFWDQSPKHDPSGQISQKEINHIS